MITKRGITVIAFSAAALVAAAALNHLVLALLGATGLAVALAAQISARQIRVEATRSAANERIPEGSGTELTYEVASTGGFQRVDVHQPLPQGIVLHGQARVQGVLGKGETLSAEFELETPVRGSYTLAPLEVRASDPFRLVERVLDIQAESLTLTVLPSEPRPRDAVGRPKHSYPRPGKFSSTKPGSGSEFYSIREYLPMDPLRLVNWKASAATGDLMVNQYQDERSTQALAVIDHRLWTAMGPFQDAPIHEVARSGALSYRLASEGGDSFTALFLGQEPRALKSDGSSAFKARYFQQLAEMEPEGTFPLEPAIRDNMHRLHEGAKVLVCSPFMHPGDLDGVILLLAHNCAVTALVPNVPEPTNELEQELYENHEENVKALRGFQVTLVELPLGVVSHAHGAGVKI